MKLYLVRHGDAVSVAENIRRPLSEDGFKEVGKIAQFLAANDLNIAHIYHSEKLRADQTAQEIAKHLSPCPTIKVLPGLLPDDDVHPMITYCNHWQEDTMLVGHLPFMANLATAILSGNEGIPCVDFQTAAVLCLEKIAMSHWCIAWFLSPSMIIT